MWKVATNILFEYQVRQYALHLIQIDGHAKPFEALCDTIQFDLLPPDYFVYSLE